MAVAGECEGAVEVDVDLCGVSRRLAEVELAGEAEGGAHGADGVRAGGADADLEEFEEAGVHAAYCRRERGDLPGLAVVWDFLFDFFSDCFFWRLW